jgi:hypothetical protein
MAMILRKIEQKSETIIELRKEWEGSQKYEKLLKSEKEFYNKPNAHASNQI